MSPSTFGGVVLTDEEIAGWRTSAYLSDTERNMLATIAALQIERGDAVMVAAGFRVEREEQRRRADANAIRFARAEARVAQLEEALDHVLGFLEHDESGWEKVPAVVKRARKLAGGVH